MLIEDKASKAVAEEKCIVEVVEYLRSQREQRQSMEGVGVRVIKFLFAGLFLTLDGWLAEDGGDVARLLGVRV